MSFSFDPSISANAVAEINANADPAPEPTPQAGQSDPASATAGDPAPVTPNPSDVNDDTLVPFEREDGTVVQMKVGELRKGYLRQSDYTRKTQEAAKARQELEKLSPAYKQLAEEREQIQQFLNNREALEQYLKDKFAANDPQFDPNDIATVEQANQLIQSQMKRLQNQMTQELAKVHQATRQELQATAEAIKAEQESAVYRKEINTHLEDIMKANPILGAVDNMQDVIRWQVLQAKPKDLNEAKALFTKVAKAQAEKLTSKFQELNKPKTEAKEKLVKGNIEPPGGTGVQPQPKSFVDRKTNTMNWKDLAAAAAESLK